MLSNLGPTHPKATDASTSESADDVEGHRVAMFIEDQKDSALGALPTEADQPAPVPTEDVQGHRVHLGTGESETEDDVQGNMLRF